MSSIVSIDTRGYDISMGPGFLRVGGGGGIAGNVYINGNVGIGTNAPTARLDVSGSIAASGRVGIGIDAPIYPLDVSGICRIGDRLEIRAPGETSFRSAYIQSTLTDLYILNQKTGPLRFGTNNGERMRITEDGYVGIKITTPVSFLEIHGSASTSHTNLPDGGANHNLNLVSTKTGSSKYSMALGVDFTSGAGYINAAGNSLIQPVCLQTRGGNVGIGTITPASTLDVNGTFGFAPNTITRLYSGKTPQYDANWNNFASSIGNTIWNGTSWSSNSDGLNYGCCAIVYGWSNIYFCTNYTAGTSSSTLTNAQMVASTRMTILSSGLVGIGTNAPTATLDVRRPGGVNAYAEESVLNVKGADYSNADGSRTVYSAGITLHASDLAWAPPNRTYGAKIYIGGGYSVGGGLGTNGPIEFSTGAAIRMRINEGGSVTIGGALSKGSGTFDIKHPIKEGYRLVHSFTESPRCDLIYRGKKQLINGQIIINIDKECVEDIDCAMTEGTFEALCANPTVYLQNNETFDKVIGKIVGNKLTILCENKTADCVIDWMVVAERKDELIKEWDKTNDNGYLKTEYKS